ncbi:6335_t:CDS:1, partial [Racocetra fulgida]
QIVYEEANSLNKDASYDAYESQDFKNKKIIDDLCKLHEEEVLKGNSDLEILNSIEQYLENNQLKP